MIWKDYLELSEIAIYSRLTRASKAPPPSTLRRNRVNSLKRKTISTSFMRYDGVITAVTDSENKL